MAGLHKSDFKNPVVNWVDTRLPMFTMMQKEYGTFPTPRNFNYFWNFGALAMVQLMIMIATGVFLAMNYTPNRARLRQRRAHHARREFRLADPLRPHERRVDVLHRDVHPLFRGLYYGSYKEPRELLWMIGVILLLMMATAFMGYVLPWGQMSYWGATVITNLFSAIPGVGQRHRHLAVGRVLGRQPDAEPLLQPALPAAVRHRRRGGPAHRGAAHHRLEQPARDRREGAAGHAAVPPVLHDQGQRGHVRVPDRLRDARVLRAGLSRPPRQLHPGQPAADAVRDRAGMVFPAVLRDPALGPEQARRRRCLFGSIALLFVLPWLDTSPVRSARFRPIYRLLMPAGDRPDPARRGRRPPAGGALGGARPRLHHLLFPALPRAAAVLGCVEKPLPLPESISRPVLPRGGGGPLPGAATARPMEKP